MNGTDLQAEIEADLRESPIGKVIYLEGKTDPGALLALLGATMPGDATPAGVRFQDVWVRGLIDKEKKGSGARAVETRVSHANRLGLRGVVGILDGDGFDYETLARAFDPPYSGPLFRWKAYCIENLIAKTGWPAAWGNEPDWPAEFLKYGPYVALNRIGLEVRSILTRLELSNYRYPDSQSPLRTEHEFSTILSQGKDEVRSFDVLRRFEEELTSFRESTARSLNEAHTLLNGKKFIHRYLAPVVAKRSISKCESDWLAHAVSVGGLPEVREWWERVTGSPP